MDDAAKKEALRLFTYGLYAVSCGEGNQRNAFTANWLTQVSFEPPLIALSVENTSTSLAIIRRTKHFAVNVLDASQRSLAGELGKPFARHPEKVNVITFGEGEHGTPIVQDAAAWVECELASEMPAGDSTLLLGRVVGAGVLRKADPLSMFAAGFKHAG